MVFVGYYESLSEMVNGVMHRAHDALPAPFDFTQMWVDGVPKHERLLSGGHPEIDEPYSVCDPTAPSMCLI